jgi:hypothetical protein
MTSSSRGASLKPWIRGVVLLCLVAAPVESFGLSIATMNPSQIATFQGGATVEGFDTFPPSTITGLTIDSYNVVAVPQGSRFSSRDTTTFTSPFFNSGGASFGNPVGNPGVPIGIFTPTGATIGGDVKSPTNVAGPLTGDGSFEAFNNGFMEVIFPADMIRVGFWITHSSGSITLITKDLNNQNLSTGDFQVTGTKGQFIGIQRDSADIRGVTIGFTQAFTIDDFTYSSTPIPEPSSLFLIATGLAALIGWRRVH